MSKNPLQFKISAELSGIRLDKALAAIDEIGTRNRAQALIENNKIKIW